MMLEPVPVRWLNVNKRQTNPRIVIHGSFTEYFGSQLVGSVGIYHRRNATVYLEISHARRKQCRSRIMPVAGRQLCSNFLYVFKAARSGPLTPSPGAAHRRPRGMRAAAH